MLRLTEIAVLQFCHAPCEIDQAQIELNRYVLALNVYSIDRETNRR